MLESTQLLEKIKHFCGVGTGTHQPTTSWSRVTSLAPATAKKKNRLRAVCATIRILLGFLKNCPVK